MKTANLRVNQLSEAGYKWYLEYLDTLDAMDVERYGSFLADECVLLMNNAEPVVGKEAVLGGLSYYWRSFGALEHELLNIYGTDRALMLETLNHYQRLDGKAVTLRAVALTDRNESGKTTS
jgi:ketosteroid isomerase-like protein